MLHENGAEPSIVGEVDDVGILRAAALRGRCIVVVPRSVVAEDLAEGRLRELGTVDGDARVYALYHDKNPAETVLRAIAALTSGP